MTSASTKWPATDDVEPDDAEHADDDDAEPTMSTMREPDDGATQADDVDRADAGDAAGRDRRAGTDLQAD